VRKVTTLAVVSDIHYAGVAERARGEFCLCAVQNPLQRLAIKLYRHYFWLRDPFAHNHLLDAFLAKTAGADLAVANGDYSCDSGFVGVSDDAAFASASECLQKLRQNFGQNLRATCGDHEFGKKPLGANIGGLRLKSFARARDDLGIEPFWQVNLGNYVLMGVVSTLVAMPIYEREAIAEERAEWDDIRRKHLHAIRAAFRDLQPYQRVILFCHDPTALPFLWHEPDIRAKLSQVERTIIGHLHSKLILYKSRILAGMPSIPFLGHTARRLSLALREARLWKPFNVLLCPSLAGIELLKDGGYYTAELDLSARQPARFQFHPLRRQVTVP
jgi:hypothetical protein